MVGFLQSISHINIVYTCLFIWSLAPNEAMFLDIVGNALDYSPESTV